MQQSHCNSSEESTCRQPDMEFGCFLSARGATRGAEGLSQRRRARRDVLCMCVCTAWVVAAASVCPPNVHAGSSSEKRSLALLGTLRPMKKNELQQQLLPRQQIPFSADQKVVRPPRPRALLLARSPPIYGVVSPENFLYWSRRFLEIFHTGIWLWLSSATTSQLKNAALLAFIDKPLTRFLGAMEREDLILFYALAVALRAVSREQNLRSRAVAVEKKLMERVQIDSFAKLEIRPDHICGNLNYKTALVNYVKYVF